MIHIDKNYTISTSLVKLETFFQDVATLYVLIRSWKDHIKKKQTNFMTAIGKIVTTFDSTCLSSPDSFHICSPQISSQVQKTVKKLEY